MILASRDIIECLMSFGEVKFGSQCKKKESGNPSPLPLVFVIFSSLLQKEYTELEFFGSKKCYPEM